jgi:uncharacterized protein
MMDLNSFNFIMTERCNFNCSYCYQERGTEDLDVDTAKRAVDFFFPFFTGKCHVNFSGGEPLLVFDEVVRIVGHIREMNHKPQKSIDYSLTTNGILLSDEMLRFLDSNRFSLNVSFDGMAQEIFREKGSFSQIVSALEKIRNHPAISLQTNSVFTPKSIEYLSESIQYILEQDVPDILFSLSITSSWDSHSIANLKEELKSLREILLIIYKKTGKIPVANYRKDSNSGGFYCPAGEDRMSLMPDGRLWGCYFFADFARTGDKTGEFEKYCFGDLDTFGNKQATLYPKILSNYSKMNLIGYQTPDRNCLQCVEMKECGLCPVEPLFSGSTLGKIPGYVCEMKKITREEKNKFWKDLERD